MSVRFISSLGDSTDVAFINIYSSGVVQRNSVVDFSRTGGVGVTPSSSSSTFTTIFGVSLDYSQGASDAFVKVCPFVPGQLFEIDCVNAASTAQIGLRHALNDNLTLRNTASDTTGATGVFRAIAMRGLTTGSGILIGEFIRVVGGVAVNTTTFS